ncbi:MAG: phosphotransferase [Myxococcales bacterium]|nr:phosphotransferase [Myxococcales bacterium]
MTSTGYDAVAAQLGGRLIGRRRLEGGVSASVEALTIEAPDGARRQVVVRMLDADGRAGLDGRGVQAEAALLAALRSAGVAVPAVLAVDVTRTRLPGMFLAMEFVAGTTDLPPDGPSQMAAFAARLHGLDAARFADVGLPARVDPVPELLSWLPRTPAFAPLRARLRAAPPRFPDAPTALLHGDLWPGNVLWRDGRIAAVLDWEDAALGHPEADLATARLELIWARGPRAADAFTAAYAARRGPPDAERLALWTLYVCKARFKRSCGSSRPPSDRDPTHPCWTP